jgi:hypothetical protein
VDVILPRCHPCPRDNSWRSVIFARHTEESVRCHSEHETDNSTGGIFPWPTNAALFTGLSQTVIRVVPSQSPSAGSAVSLRPLAATKIEVPAGSDLSLRLDWNARPDLVSLALQYPLPQRQFSTRLPASADDQDDWWDQSHYVGPLQAADESRAVYQPMDSVDQLLVLLTKSSFRGRILDGGRADDIEASD